MSEQLLRIRVRQTTDQRSVVQFVDFTDGVRVGLQFRYSRYEDRWVVWLLALDGSVISGPRKLVNGIDILLDAKHDPRVPQGELFCYSADRQPPTIDTVDTDVLLLYRRTAA